MFPGLPAGALVDAIVAAEELGLDEVWVADEGVSRDPVAVLAAAAPATSTIRLAIGITSPALRHPGAIAASIATLDELSGGRAVLGLGVGGHLSLAPFGIEVDRPVALLRDAIATVRAVHRGEAGGGYEPPEHAIPPRDIPVWVGARGPQLVRLAARVADGLFLSGCSTAQHDGILANAATVGPVDTAIYQTAVDRPGADTERTWDDAATVLVDAIERFRPTSIGFNLVQFAGAADAVAVVERAARLLCAVSPPAAGRS